MKVWNYHLELEKNPYTSIEFYKEDTEALKVMLDAALSEAKAKASEGWADVSGYLRAAADITDALEVLTKEPTLAEMVEGEE